MHVSSTEQEHYPPLRVQILLRSANSVDALVVVVKQASLVGTDYDEEDDEGNKVDDKLDDPV